MAAGQKRRRSQDHEDHAESTIPPHASHIASEDAVEDDPPPKKKPQHRRSLFVRSLPASTTTDKLVSHFSESYPIKHATAVIDPETGLCKGYGFITFADTEDAQRALDEFNGSVFAGKKIRIEIAEPRHRDLEVADRSNNEQSKSERQDVAPTSSGRAEHTSGGTPKLIIRNLPWSIKKPEQLEQLFRSYGKIKSSTIPMKRPGLLSGFGFVVMRGRKNAEKALEGVNGKIIDGRTLAVDWAVDKDTWQAQMAASDKGPHQGQDDTVSGNADNGTLHEDTNMASDLSEGEDQSLKTEEEDAEESGGNSREDEAARRNNNNSSTLFIRNVSFDTTDEDLESHFAQFGRVRYARVVMDNTTERSKGTAFVCFQEVEDARACLRKAPKTTVSAQASKSASSENQSGPSILENLSLDPTGAYTLDSRVLNVSQAVDRDSASRLASESFKQRSKRDTDKRRIYLLSEGTITPDFSLYGLLSAAEIAMRDASLKQRRTILQSNPSLNLSLTRLSVRNIPRSVGSKQLKALAREAVVGFATDVKEGRREKLSKEELERGGEAMGGAERLRKEKGVGIVKQAKVVFEGREGGKVDEKSGAGRSRGYGFIEYYTHRNALMGLRWLNGHAIDYRTQTQGAKKEGKGKKTEEVTGKEKRLIVEFAIENAQVVNRRRDRETRSRGGGAKVGGSDRLSSRGSGEDLLDDDDGDGDTEGEGEGEDGQSKSTKGKTKGKGRGGGSIGGTAARDKQAQRARIIMKKRAARRDRKKTAKGGRT